ncbi:hypothetical protein SOPP22_05720 [Shewanella sp. OPT22]|nr:hypothetical protein SOPP22_05720 [Shewanella sp. OPT22]
MNMIEKVWKEFSQQLLAFIVNKVSDKSIAEDVLQDVFIKVYQNIETLEDKDKVRPWLYSITRNAIYDLYRKKSLDYSDVELDELPLVSLHKNENLDRCLDILIKNLSADYSTVLDASELQGRKQKEIAEEQGLSLPAVKSRIKRGRAQLKDKLQACCDFEFRDDGGVESFCLNKCGCDG